LENLTIKSNYFNKKIYLTQKLSVLIINKDSLSKDLEEECFAKKIKLYLWFKSNYIIKNNIPLNLENLLIDFKINDINQLKDTVENNLEYKKVINDKYKEEIINNIPPNIKEIKINNIYKRHLIHKIPFGCKIIDCETGKEIL